MKKILIVDDELDFCRILSGILKEEGYEIFVAHDGKAALKKIEEEKIDLIFLDLRLPDMNGLEALEKAKGMDTNLQAIIFTAYGEIQTAVQAMKLGAFDYLCKPFNNEEIIFLVKRVFQMQNLTQEVQILRAQLEKAGIKGVVGESKEIKRVLLQIEKVSPTDFSVIIQGESGTGKELFARLIHQNSLRKDKPFIAIDCGALPETLVESELFGHEKGAFTGAQETKPGQFELAEGGTLFLDEIGNLTLSTQVKLLRVLQEREIRRIGGKRTIDINVRIVAATNLMLENAAKKNLFRNDLYQRLNEFPIFLPLLKDRKDDIVFLAKYFLSEANKELNKNVQGFSPQVLSSFLGYSWPGNVRELRNVVKRAGLLTDDIISLAYLPLEIRGLIVLQDTEVSFSKEESSLKDARKQTTMELEKRMIEEVLQKTGGNKAKAASILKIDYKTLYNKIKKYAIQFGK